MYQRVIPRDLFNEAKLLKCLGQLTLLIHDAKGHGLRIEHEGDAFDIDQDSDSGSLFCRNLAVMLGETQIPVSTRYNCKSPYPLLFTDSEGDEQSVFNDDGSFSSEFLAYIQGARS